MFFIAIATSLSIPRPTNAAGVQISGKSSKENFYAFLEQEMKKIENFTKAKVRILPTIA